INRPPEISVFDNFMARPAYPFRKLRRIDIRLQPRPALESALPCNRQLRIGQVELPLEDCVVAQRSAMRMKLPNPLCSPTIARSMRLLQVSCLMLQMLKIWLGW